MANNNLRQCNWQMKRNAMNTPTLSKKRLNFELCTARNSLNSSRFLRTGSHSNGLSAGGVTSWDTGCCCDELLRGNARNFFSASLWVCIVHIMRATVCWSYRWRVLRFATKSTTVYNQHQPYRPKLQWHRRLPEPHTVGQPDPIGSSSREPSPGLLVDDRRENQVTKMTDSLGRHRWNRRRGQL